jgi:hypothetical protein
VVNADDRADALQVDDDAPGQRHGPAAHARAAAVGDERNPVLSAEADDGLDLGLVFGPDHAIGRVALGLAAQLPDLELGPEVGRVRDEIRQLGGDAGGPDDGGETSDELRLGEA